MDYPEYKAIIFQKGERIGRVTLNRPEKLNAMNRQMSEEIDDVFTRIKADPEVHVVIMKGAGRAFSSGGDMAGYENPEGHVRPGYATSDLSVWERQGVLRQMDRWFKLFWELPQPIIAQLHGWTAVVGLEMAMQADIIIAAEDAMFHNRYMHGGGRIFNLWPITIGIRRTKELLFTGPNFTGKQAAEWGMINRAVPADQLEAEVEKIAKAIAAQPLETIALDKFAVNKFYEVMGLRIAMEYSGEIHAIAHGTERGRQLDQVGTERGWHDMMRERDSTFPLAWEGQEETNPNKEQRPSRT